jgi:hypothetical protein
MPLRIYLILRSAETARLEGRTLFVQGSDPGGSRAR